MTTSDESLSPVEPDPGSDGAADVSATTGADASRRRRHRLLAFGTAGALVIGVGGFVALQSADEAGLTSAAQGAEGTRTFEGVPDEMPRLLVPSGASGVEGTVSRVEGAWSASVRFETEGDHEELARGGDPGIAEDGFVMRQRAYDENVMQVIYDGEDGSVLTVTYLRPETDGGRVRVAAVLTSP